MFLNQNFGTYHNMNILIFFPYVDFVLICVYEYNTCLFVCLFYTSLLNSNNGLVS